MSAKSSTSSDLTPIDDPDDLPKMIQPTRELVEAAYAAIMDKQLPPEIGDPAITARLILERIRRGTFDESLDPVSKLPNWYDTYGERAVTVYGFHLNPSSFRDDPDNQSSSSVYAACEITDPDTGELVTVSTGGTNVLTQLVKAWEEHRFPFRAAMVAQETGQRGRRTFYLRKVEASG